MHEQMHEGKLSAIRRIAVLRAGGLGDLIFTLPAIEALTAAYPDAEIVLLGNCAAVELLGSRPGTPHRVIELPPIAGVGAPERTETDEEAVETFVAARRAEQYDLAVQMHGGGRHSNAFLLRLGARFTVGTRTDDAAQLDRTLNYVYYQHEVMRWLEVAGLAGADPVVSEPRIVPLPQEATIARELLRADCGAEGDRPMVAMHPGATDPRRRWPTASFARMAAALEQEGVHVVLVGTGPEDSQLCQDIVQQAERMGASRIEDLAGSLSLSELVGVLGLADVTVGNDSGPRHLAQALGTRTVSIFWCGNLMNAGPFTRLKHRVQISWTTHCPECGVDCTQVGWTAERCEHNPSFVADVAVEQVLHDVRSLLVDARRW